MNDLSSEPSHPRNRWFTVRSDSFVLASIILLIVATGVYGIAWPWFRRDRVENASGIVLRPVFRGPYERVVLEQGLVESSTSVEIRCEVKSQTAGGTEILWVVDEGTHVKKGEKLVSLDRSALDQEFVQQRIVCNASRALMVETENTLRAAEIGRIEYLEGVFRRNEQAILSEMFVAEENLRQAQLSYQSTERLATKGIVTSLQLEGSRFSVEKARNELEAARTKLEILQKYTKEKTLKQFDADIATSTAKWEAAKKSHELEMVKLKEIEEQIGECTIVAPADGQVVYANIFDHHGTSEFVVEAGASIRERQVIIRLPDPQNMQVKATISESRISGIEVGMPVDIEFDAIRDRTFRGEVIKVNQYAEPINWHSGNTKKFAAWISIFAPPSELRAGMSAEVRIHAEQQEDALQVPVQALYETKGRFYCLVKDDEQWKTYEVKVDSSNDVLMTIEAGLAEGQLVVMNPRSYRDMLDIPALPDQETVVEGDEGTTRSPLQSAQ